VYSHPVHGETFSYAHTKRTREEWAEAHHGRARGGQAALPMPDKEMSEDDLGMLLSNKKQREDDVEAMKKQVYKDMTQDMDTGTACLCTVHMTSSFIHSSLHTSVQAL
jgi:hypothetical protein